MNAPDRGDPVPGREHGPSADDRALADDRVLGADHSQRPSSRSLGAGDLAPDAADASVPVAARWLVESRTPFEQLITFGPSVFTAYARLRFIPDPSRSGQDEADNVLPINRLSELEQTQRVLHHLAQYTSTPADCCFCIWDGYPDITVPPEVGETELVVLPHRRYVMFRGPVSWIDSFAADFGSSRSIAPPAFVWPADHSWCFARDVDPHWAGVGAPRAALDTLAADALLDVVPAVPGEPQPRYR